jgi:superfamily II DNA or RNA helicase
MSAVLYQEPGASQTFALLRRVSDDLGLEALDLMPPPVRFWSDGERPPSDVKLNVDARRVTPVASPAEMLAAGPGPGETWSALTRRSLARLSAWFLLAEDPQRRLEAQPIVTLAHQASVVQHIQEDPALLRVLLADEVGLGKTIEAGLLIQGVLAQNPSARVLYLAPARLVRNVRRELDLLGLGFRSWVASVERDATLKDPRVVASIHRASHKGQLREVVASGPWDMIVVDECHHLSAWSPGGGSPVAQYKLVLSLAEGLREDGRLVLMSGTPHQGNATRFQNLLQLLKTKRESEAEIAGRVIYRIKDDVRDWEGQPLFPGRQVNAPRVLDLGPEHRAWLADIHAFFEPERTDGKSKSAQRRAAGWRVGQALQWATSSVQAGLGYLLRQAIRAGCTPGSLPGLDEALAAIRPYRRGPADEPLAALWKRMAGEVVLQSTESEVEDIEDIEQDDGTWRPDRKVLSRLLEAGVSLARATADKKWDFVFNEVLREAGDEKVVLFAQPIETVTTVAAYLARVTGERPALILGGQSEADRALEVQRFWAPRGPRFLVSSRAGGEGLNLQVARRLVHLDVPWNPMDLEQRIGRVHRFGSKRTILVDTIVVKDSREVDTYSCAREKLQTIASTMGTTDRFEELFGRVMALVPPEELQDIFGQGPVGPLSDGERDAVAELVTKGYADWKRFHDRYSEQQRRISALDPGQATWGDLAAFAREHLGCVDAPGFTALRFVYEGGEAVSASRAATVLSFGDKAYACGDYGGMPAQSDEGRVAERLGSNVSLLARKLREIGLGLGTSGAAQVRWPEGLPRPEEGPFGVLVMARQSVRFEGRSATERGLSLCCVTVDEQGKRTALEGAEKGAVLRALIAASPRREPEAMPGLWAALLAAEASLVVELRWPTEADREARISHAVTPLLAAVVG